jgi:hypothetical protein
VLFNYKLCARHQTGCHYIQALFHTGSRRTENEYFTLVGDYAASGANLLPVFHDVLSNFRNQESKIQGGINLLSRTFGKHRNTQHSNTEQHRSKLLLMPQFPNHKSDFNKPYGIGFIVI